MRYITAKNQHDLEVLLIYYLYTENYEIDDVQGNEYTLIGVDTKDIIQIKLP